MFLLYLSVFSLHLCLSKGTGLWIICLFKTLEFYSHYFRFCIKISSLFHIHQYKFIPAFHFNNVFEDHFYILFSIYYEYFLRNTIDSVWKSVNFWNKAVLYKDYFWLEIGYLSFSLSRWIQTIWIMYVNPYAFIWDYKPNRWVKMFP